MLYLSFLHNLTAVHDVMQEPHIYRMQEAVLHYGEAIKAIVNEECGMLSTPYIHFNSYVTHLIVCTVVEVYNYFNTYSRHVYIQ